MNDYRGKKIVVVGLGETGVETACFLLEREAHVLVSDNRQFKATQPYGDQLLDLAPRLPGSLLLEMGGHKRESFLSADLIIVSPGVPLAQDIFSQARSAGVEIISEVELAYRHLQGQVIGITGSNGKTTTTALIDHLLRHCGRKTLLAGNIRPPLISCVGKDAPNTQLVVELSSFQLEGIDKFRCHTAVLLNVTPDHMDRYGSFADYVNTKARIFKNQTAHQYAVLNRGDRIVQSLVSRIKSHQVLFSIRPDTGPGLSLQGEWIEYRGGNGTVSLIKTSEIPLKGLHNVENVMAALAVGLIQGLEKDAMIEAIKTFKAVEHRLEYVSEIDGISFYNDSKATNMDSCIKSLQSFDNPILLILGGRNKGGDFGELKDLVAEKARRVLAIGESSQEILETLSGYASVTCCASLREAVEKAFREAQPGDTVLLAPACASFDMFNNYEHRGRIFKEEVGRLQKSSHLCSVH